jgi:hypothetical protein
VPQTSAPDWASGDSQLAPFAIVPLMFSVNVPLPLL